MIRIPALILGCLFWATTVFGAQPFVIQDIRVEGLQRISEGTIYNYLPLDRGDTLTASAGRTAIRELYNTGFFQDISLRKEGNILVIEVLERPAIASVSLSGNKAIKDEELRRVLHDIGLSEGEVFDRLVLDRLSQELVNQYFSQGRYAVDVDTRVTELDRNRVRIAIVIDEGDVMTLGVADGLPDLRVQTRSGDTPAGERQRMLRRPPEILITTPESLSLLLTTRNGQNALTRVETVILDEVHAVVDNRRGVQLMTALERLVDLSGEFQRLALPFELRRCFSIALESLSRTPKATKHCYCCSRAV